MIALGKQWPLNIFFVVNIKNLIFHYIRCDRTQKDPYKFKNSDLGSVQITLDFLHNSPYYNCTIKTKGFRHDEIEDLFEYVWKNRHSNSNKDLR